MPSKQIALKGIERMGMSVPNCTPPPKKRWCNPPSEICDSQCSRTTSREMAESNSASMQVFCQTSRGSSSRCRRRSCASSVDSKKRSTIFSISAHHWAGVLSPVSSDKVKVMESTQFNNLLTRAASKLRIAACGKVPAHALPCPTA